MDARSKTHDGQDKREVKNPRAHVKHVYIEARSERREAGKHDHGQDDDIGKPAVVLPGCLGIVHAPKGAGDGPHEDAERGLAGDDYCGRDAEVGVQGLEVRVVALDLVGLDDGDAGHEGQAREPHDADVQPRALPLPLGVGGRRRLQDQNADQGDGDGGALEEGVRREEWQELLAERRVPDLEAEHDDADKGEKTCSFKPDVNCQFARILKYTYVAQGHSFLLLLSPLPLLCISVCVCRRKIWTIDIPRYKFA